MLIGIVGDVHWSTYSSIIRSRGDKYSTRLENLIKSVNWAEKELSVCDSIVYAGDFFDRADVSSEELSALNEIEWCSVPHRFLVGNHEASTADLSYNCPKIFESMPSHEAVDTVDIVDYGEFKLVLIPYQTDKNRFDLSDIAWDKKTIVFSHNDLQIQYGAYESKTGYKVEDIEKCCDLFINGHLHNFSTIGEKIINIGNLSGMGFGEDANIYPHNIAVLDTDDLSIKYIENPYAFNFYKVDYTDGIKRDNFKKNAVVSFVCREKDIEALKERCKNDKNIFESRMVVKRDMVDAPSHEKELRFDDHLSMFYNYVHSTIKLTDEEEEELLGVVKV